MEGKEKMHMFKMVYIIMYMVYNPTCHQQVEHGGSKHGNQFSSVPAIA